MGIMENIELLPDDLMEVVDAFVWKCGCGQTGLHVSVTKKGKVQAHCFGCGRTIFWNDVSLFGKDRDPFVYYKEKPIIKRAKNGWLTAWYPLHRVRVFYRGKDENED